MSLTVIVPTFGDEAVWNPLAERAVASVEAQTVKADEIIRVHSSDLATARNTGAAQAKSDWLIFCDADDELDPGYIEAMLEADGEIRRPSTVGFVDGVQEGEPNLIPARPLNTANYIVIAAMIERARFLEVGGFDPELRCLEDWDLWLKLTRTGARVVDVPDAIYRIHIRPLSRNQNEAEQFHAYNLIRKRHR